MHKQPRSPIIAAAILPIPGDDQRLEATSNSASKAALERRESERAIDRGDGRRELYRAVFIGFIVRPDGLSPLVFGALKLKLSCDA